jgi:hypothetical protein
LVQKPLPSQLVEPRKPMFSHLVSSIGPPEPKHNISALYRYDTRLFLCFSVSTDATSPGKTTQLLKPKRPKPVVDTGLTSCWSAPAKLRSPKPYLCLPQKQNPSAYLLHCHTVPESTIKRQWSTVNSQQSIVKNYTKNASYTHRFCVFKPPCQPNAGLCNPAAYG